MNRGTAIPRLREIIAQNTTACIVWPGAKMSAGYGAVGRGRGIVLAHRLVWEWVHGPIANGLFVLHRCDNKPCVNPAHLFLGTQQENVRDMIAKGRNRSKDTCLRGADHPAARLSPEQVRALRDEYALGNVTQEKLGRKYRIAEGHVHRIIHRKVWKCVP